jgi:DNA-binding beta-propeller fold protein YncE
MRLHDNQSGERRWNRRAKRLRSPVGMVVAGALALAVAGIAAEKRPQKSVPAPVAMVWPAAPEAPRIAYVQSIGRPAEAGAKVSGFGRLANWVTGSDKGNERFQKPFGIALDEEDNLCLTDTDAQAVCFFDRSRKTWQRWEQVGKLRFASPVAVAKRKETFFVADSSLASVVAFNGQGKLLFQITNKLERPCGLVLVGERLAVVDSQRHCVVLFDLRGHCLSEFGRRGTGAGEFNFPTHIAADSTGNVFVTDSMNSRLQMFGPDCKFVRQIGCLGDSVGQFSRPKGVAVDSLGHVYVLDGIFDNIQVFDPAGRFLLNLGETGAGAGQFWLPNGIAISRSNEIFVADSYNHRVQKFKYIGQR